MKDSFVVNIGNGSWHKAQGAGKGHHKSGLLPHVKIIMISLRNATVCFILPRSFDADPWIDDGV
jgi:hypothetical protein